MTQPTSTAVATSNQTALTQLKRRFGRELTTLEENAREKFIILIQQGFNPFTDLAIYEHEPYVLIDGWYNAVQRSGQRIGRMPAHPVPQDERTLYGLIDDEVGVICTLYLAGETEPFATGFGRASREHPYRNNPAERLNPYRQAEKRAEGQTLRKTLRMIGMRLPDIGTADAGVVIDTSFKELPDNEPPPATQPRPAPRTTGPAPAPSRDKDWDTLEHLHPRNLGNLWTLAQQHLGLSRPFALATLGVKAQEEIADLAQAWQSLVASAKKNGQEEEPEE